ncbi:AbrB family transcriptional regulator [Lentzea sp. NBRC 105346]|uniref:AbrB/MazE/SpoVT family DNA-binding domain-containing protein n=1 Tax=Lentzea sp. NBRC 105346 TaxID=3032205 RepID=UPI0024A4ED1D|nr:AbrB/MazE/SpoVT family DNA-binding domain-containing protein [Lentzea sp. NBRC 105346]GLZ32704.1 AbrB family transcriptional regulator [Lentzea sp. NBRC 105346]
MTDTLPAMKVTTKGQVTIPLEVREQLGIRPGDAVRFHVDVAHHTATIVKVDLGEMSHGRRVAESLLGKGDVKMTTDEIMALTRGE